MPAWTTSLLRDETPLPIPLVASATTTSWPRSAAGDCQPDHTRADHENLHGFRSCWVYCKRKSRWRSLMADDAGSVVRVCAKADVAPGSVKAFAVGPNPLAVYNIDGIFYVTDDECTHAAASLADGMLDGDVIECCMHFGSFHVPPGKA